MQYKEHNVAWWAHSRVRLNWKCTTECRNFEYWIIFLNNCNFNVLDMYVFFINWIWIIITGSIPEFVDGIVHRYACVRGFVSGDCCKKTIDIQVRNCFTYNVYHLSYTALCSRAYCFGKLKVLHTIFTLHWKFITLINFIDNALKSCVSDSFSSPDHW